MRFYIKYIAPDRDKIIKNGFQNTELSSLENWYSIMGLQFENLVKSNRHLIREELGITGASVVKDGGFFQRKSSRTRGCQIDYMIQTKENILYVCEIKTGKNYIRPAVIEDVKDKIQSLSVPKHFSVLPVLIFAGQLSEEVEDSKYFTKIIDFTKFLGTKY